MKEGQKGGKEEKKSREIEKRRRRKRDGKSLCERKKEKGRKEGRENKGEGEREERRGRERRIENRESGIRNVPPSPDTFPSTKLENNMTPIKGRLRKNTTPTSRGPTKLNQNLQADPRRRRSSVDASSRAGLSYVPEGAEYPKYKLHSNEVAIYKKAKALGNSPNRSKFSINQN